MKLKILSSSNYDDKSKNYGDCIIIDTGRKVIVYDCGSEEHAKEVERYINEKGYEKVYIILSHNDADHYNGIRYLIDKNKVYSITTLLLYKHLDDILKELDDGRRTKKGLIKQLKEYFDNIDSLSRNNLNDAMDRDLELDPCINFVGPSYDYLIEAVAKALDNSESDTLDMETIVNAISVQIEVIINNQKVLLAGDASFEAIRDKITEYAAIQLPHHGKFNQASEIFEHNKGKSNIIYLVSDNTGNTNGGSDELMKSDEILGKKIKNTQDGPIELTIESFIDYPKGCYQNEIHNP